jgi:acyl-CoA dehydrogenase
MACDFTTEPEFQEKLDSANEFVGNSVEPLDALFSKLAYQRITKPRQ